MSKKSNTDTTKQKRMQKKLATKARKDKIDKLGEAMDDYLASGLSLSEYIRSCSFNEYADTGDESLLDSATDYFVEHLD